MTYECDDTIDLGEAIAETKGLGGDDVDTNGLPKPIFGLFDD